MNVADLQELYSQRVEGETINETLERIKSNQELPKQEIDVSYDEELSIPRYKIIQPSCTIEKAVAGNFRNMVTEEETDKLEDVVFLIQQNSRSLFPKDDFSGAKRCYSYNGYKPSLDVKLRTGQDPVSTCCATREDGKLKFICPLAEWRNELGEIDLKGNYPPPCKPNISFLGVDSNLMPFWLILTSSALVETKAFLKYIKYQKEVAKRQIKLLDLYDFRVTITLELITSKKGKFFLPKFVKKQVITDQEERKLLAKCYEEFKDRLLSDPLIEEN